MQLFAADLDKKQKTETTFQQNALYEEGLEQKLIFADEAELHKNYSCIECGEVVRVRPSRLGNFHFYHLSKNSCRLAQKSELHLAAQLYLQKLLPDSQLERAFPQIQRVADVYLPKEQVAFEIQCSWISRQEVEARMKAYASIGIKVIWCLSMKQFGRKAPTAFEAYLVNKPHCYFSREASRERMGREKERFIFFKPQGMQGLFKAKKALIDPLTLLSDALCWRGYWASVNEQPKRRVFQWVDSQQRPLYCLLKVYRQLSCLLLQLFQRLFVKLRRAFKSLRPCLKSISRE